jgi:hypothetical protein
MSTSKRQLEAASDPDRVLAWRIERLREAGFAAALAESVALNTGYDLHELLELIDRGCPAELAARILAPLENERRSC